MAGIVGLTPGSVFAADYRILRPLSGGGMGAVYAAEQISTGNLRALKLMHPHLVEDEALRRRFEREARVGSRIASDHIVQVIAAGIDEPTGTPWIAMEMLEGETLGAYVERRGALSKGEAAEIIRQLGHALGAAHAVGVVHRDLKPDNIFIASARRSGAELLVKVLDFGIAKVVAEAKPSATAPMGTLAWMAPEQTEASAAIAPGADVWALGLLAFWMLTGKSYWLALDGRGAASAPRLVRELVFDPLPPASERAAVLEREGCLPPAFDAWFARSVAREPEARFHDGGEACGALLQVLAGAEGAEGAPGASVRSAPARPLAELATTRLGPTPTKAAPVDPVGETLATGPTEIEHPPSAVAPTAEPATLVPAPAQPQRRRGWKAALTIGVAGLIALGAALGRSKTSALPAPPAPSASVAPRPTAITDLPPPPSTSPQARSAYAAALQSLRDANWGQAEESLQEAVRLDPSLAVAHLRLAMAADPENLPALRARYALAVRGRAGLGERDQAVLHALEAIYIQEPRDSEACAARLRAATERFPFDAELFAMLGSACRGGMKPDASIRALERAVELDPAYADAWSGLTNYFTDLDRLDEAAHAVDRCIAISPTSADCLSQRALIHDKLGRCVAMEADLHRAVAIGARPMPWVYQSWVDSLYALDRPAEMILEALQQKWSRLPEDRRRVDEVFDRVALDMDEGQFLRAEQRILEGQRAAALDPSAELHREYATLLTVLYREMGQPERAAGVADDYLKRKDAWQGESPRSNTLWMLRVRASGGGPAKASFLAERAAWIEQQKKEATPAPPWELWNGTHGVVLDRAQAEEALAALPANAGPAPASLAMNLGFVHELAGKHAEALPLLRESTKGCRRLGPKVDLVLAGALEGTGDRQGACAMYTRVLARWGHAVPRSLTAEQARDHARVVCAGATP